MSLFKFFWLRRFIRKRTKKIEIDTAELWKKRLSIVYFLIAWNVFGMVCYQVYSGKGDWAKYYGLKKDADKNIPSSVQWADVLNLGGTVRVVEVKKFTKTSEYEFDRTSESIGVTQYFGKPAE